MSGSRLILGLAATGAAGVFAGCGSSSTPTSTITVGAEPSTAQTGSAAASPGASSNATAPTATGQTPSSGPLSKEPTASPPKGAAPARLVTRDLVTGSGQAAKAGDTVTVNYVGVLFHGGKVFDASWNRNQPLSFPLGQAQVIPGWDQGVAGMRVGGRRELIIPAKLAYGASGRPPIPPNAPLVFVVDLLSVQGP